MRRHFHGSAVSRELQPYVGKKVSFTLTIVVRSRMIGEMLQLLRDPGCAMFTRALIDQLLPLVLSPSRQSGNLM